MLSQQQAGPQGRFRFPQRIGEPSSTHRLLRRLPGPGAAAETSPHPGSGRLRRMFAQEGDWVLSSPVSAGAFGAQRKPVPARATHTGHAVILDGTVEKRLRHSQLPAKMRNAGPRPWQAGMPSHAALPNARSRNCSAQLAKARNLPLRSWRSNLLQKTTGACPRSSRNKCPGSRGGKWPPAWITPTP